jgi:hypothetical protein
MRCAHIFFAAEGGEALRAGYNIIRRRRRHLQRINASRIRASTFLSKVSRPENETFPKKAKISYCNLKKSLYNENIN